MKRSDRQHGAWRQWGRWGTIAALALAGVLWAAPPAPQPTTQPASQPGSNLDYWLDRAQPATDSVDAATQPRATSRPATARGGVPGVVELSDGRILAGVISTTADQPLLVHLPDQKRWRRVPLAAVLSITAKVVSEDMEPQWRAKETGSSDRIYTGRLYPTRRLRWVVRLADGSTITGTIKGQPITLAGPAAGAGEGATTRPGPFILAERTRGEAGESFDELVYVQRIILSQRAMQDVMVSGPTSRGSQARPKQ
ncbi:hypothetical protein LCGC14_0238930 [marine sediment metagenome]|uniref:Uncharacterized protein n=1 Tax=marine sediment metagenome TaxID=412755 RepID=A0A0F9WSX6_9ZZZZ